MLWDWDEVFRYLVRKCNQHGGYYELSIDEGAQFKKGSVGKGWGEYNLRRNIIPRYRRIYPNYKFGISSDRRYLWCVKIR